MIDLLMPPARYDVPYTGPLIEHVLTLEQIDKICSGMGVRKSQGQVIFGCARGTETPCVIYIPKIAGYITAEDQAKVRRHELAHCNGWPGDHPP